MGFPLSTVTSDLTLPGLDVPCRYCVPILGFRSCSLGTEAARVRRRNGSVKDGGRSVASWWGPAT